MGAHASQLHQPQDYKPYEKTRTVFFIFIEEVILRLLAESRKAEEDTESEEIVQTNS
ncbi:MAG: hypothetical protein GX184_10310 [Clostridiaceae bacterium]|nr:hypothetical protein [Clostridiaceae bacterium]